MSEITVVAAIWQDVDGRFFLAQRAANKSQGGLWEFPGGKVEAGEEETEALARELLEEFAVIAIIGDFYMETLYSYSEDKIIKLRAYHIHQVQGKPVLNEHQDLIWARPEEILALDLSPADIPITEALMKDEIIKSIKFRSKWIY